MRDKDVHDAPLVVARFAAVPGPGTALTIADLGGPLAPETSGARLVVEPCERRAGWRGVSTATQAQLDGIQAWGGRTETILTILETVVTAYPWLLSGDGKRDTVSAKTFLAVLRAYVSVRDWHSGLIDATYAAIAEQVDKSAATVARALRIARRRLGVIVDVGHARELTSEEREALLDKAAQFGIYIGQHGLPPVRSTHIPAWLGALIEAHTAAQRAAAVARAAVRKTTAALTSGKPRHARHVAGGLSQASPARSKTWVSNPPQSSPHLPVRADARGQDDDARTPSPVPSGRHVGVTLARALIRTLPLAAGLRPWAIARVLAPFETAGWTADVFLAAVEGLYRDLGWTRPTHITSPGGLIAWLATHLDPTTYDPATDRIQRARPCGHPDCDHGWRTAPDTTSGHPTVTPCPACPPIVRTAEWQIETNRLHDLDELPGLDAPETTAHHDDERTTPAADSVDLDNQLDARLDAAWAQIITEHTPLAALLDHQVRDLLLADPVRERLSAYRAAGLTLPQIEHIDPAAARRAYALGRIHRTDRRHRAHRRDH